MNEEELKSILLRSKLLTPEAMERVLSERKKLKRPLERLILEMKLLSKEDLYNAIAKERGVEYKDLTDLEISPDLLNIYPEDLARRTHSVPLFIKDNFLHISMEDPGDISYIDQIQLFTGYPLEIYLSAPFEIEEVLNRVYRRDGRDLFSELKVEEARRLVETPSIAKVVDTIIVQGVRDRATDIHIEPEEDITRIRFRIDGVLHEIPSPPKEWELAIISRIKVLSGMDIAESRAPQEGQFRRKIDDRLVDFRVSTLPTIYGENLVMRLLDTSSITIGLERLGFTTPEDLKRYEELIAKPYGLILSTGPTGCGKTTTLYSALMRINTPERNVVTLEDPVEYRLGLVRQVQINPRAGITYADGLKAIFRQDPDVIMVGEIRDLETARMAVQAALTGHLVFSTLHTNDAPSAPARLVDMGIEPFLVSAALIGVMAQRLVRVICSKCKEPYRPSLAVLERWGLGDRKESLVVYRGRGCQECKGTGFYGRTGIFELMTIDDELREMITSGAPPLVLRRKACEKGMRLLWRDGRKKVLKGITTFEEVARVCEEIELRSEPGLIEAKPYIKPLEKIEAKEVGALKEIKVEAKDLEEYRKKIARWLSGEK